VLINNLQETNMLRLRTLQLFCQDFKSNNLTQGKYLIRQLIKFKKSFKMLQLKKLPDSINHSSRKLLKNLIRKMRLKLTLNMKTKTQGKVLINFLIQIIQITL